MPELSTKVLVKLYAMYLKNVNNEYGIDYLLDLEIWYA